IGGAASRALAEAGATVLAQYWTGGPELAEFQEAGIATLKLDLTAPGAAEHLIQHAMSRMGGLDVLINNAGGMIERRDLVDFDDALYDHVLDLNVRQVFACCRAAARLMRKQGHGNIINVTSIAAKAGGSAGSSVYAGTKGFVSAFTKTMARELAGDGIRVNAVSPGTIHTAFHDRHSTPEKLEATRRTIPMQRLGVAEDCAGTFVYLASDKASGYVTGQVIEVNGGQLMA
ncbi:MAG: SDR family oxidoreductase, partial [Rhizobiales bacterium]|nr:SDR family oxidoreductase [Hyphomicrobiales bacterium]